MRLLQVWFWSLLFVSPLASANDFTPEAIRSLVAETLKKNEKTPEATGVSLGIIKDGEVFFQEGFGYRDRAQKLPVTAKTLFGIGSTTKAFTALGLKLLEQENKVNFQAPVQNYLPRYSMESKEVAAKITLDEMLSHRSGLPRHDILWYLTDFGRYDLMEKIAFLEMNKKEGMGYQGKFQYNNLMYVTAGIVLETLSGQSWEQFTTDRIFRPLGMHSTFVSVQGLKENTDVALPYTGEVLAPFKDLDRAGPIGSINSNAEDLAKWLKFQLQEGKLPNGEELINAELFRSQFAVKTEINERVKYGLGWVLLKMGEDTVYWHNGNIDGYSAFVAFIPKQNFALSILVNQTGSEVPDDLFENILRAFYLSKAPKQPEEPKNLEGPVAKKGILAQYSKELRIALQTKWGAFALPIDVKIENLDKKPETDKAAGEYWHPAYGNLRVYVNKEGKLRLHYYLADSEIEWKEGANFLFSVPSAGVFPQLDGVMLMDEVGLVQKILVPLEPAVAPIEFIRKP